MLLRPQNKVPKARTAGVSPPMSCLSDRSHWNTNVGGWEGWRGGTPARTRGYIGGLVVDVSLVIRVVIC